MHARRRRIPLAVALLLLALAAGEARRRRLVSAEGARQVQVGTVVAVHDGDTLTLRVAGRRERVRLAQIDAPEHGQPWGRRARQALAALADGRDARLEVLDRDDYGRSVGDLYVGDVFVNEVLVREGHAWAYPRYVRSARITEAEAEARRARRGLWRLPAAEREPPWEWRHAHRRRSPR